MIIVSDTTAITSLTKVARANLLHEVFGKVLIPEAVRDELLRYHSSIPGFLDVWKVRNRAGVELLQDTIDRGEAEAIILAEEVKAAALLIDDKQGRLIAEDRGIRCIGLAGALLIAKESGIIESLRDVLDELEGRANFYLDARVRQSLLQRANE